MAFKKVKLFLNGILKENSVLLSFLNIGQEELNFTKNRQYFLNEFT
jgi:hypothetical protein